jgi:hypothetical protein
MAAALVLGTTLAAAAQSATPTTAATTATATATPNLLNYSSSWSGLPEDGSAAAARVNSLSVGPNPSASPQGYGGYGRRRPYGRPATHDRNTNPDGSTKVAFEAGAGFAHPAGDTQKYNKTGYNISFGAGRNFNRAFGVLAQYDYSSIPLSNAVMNQVNATGAGVIGNAHTWSLTLNPVISFSDKNSHYGAYIVGGGGFYRKLTSFVQPTTGLCYDPYYGYYPCTSNQLVAHWSNNAGGVNLGMGFTWRPSTYSNMKLFAESRYTWVDNQPAISTYANSYPSYNNRRTEYFPVTFGLRF